MDAIDSARAILAEANLEAGRIVERAQAEATTIETEARERGLVSAVEEMSEQLLRAEQARRRFLDAARDEVESSALTVARLLVGRSIDTDPAWLSQLVGQHLSALQGAQHIAIICHPLDRAAVEREVSLHVGRDALDLVADEQVTRGGFRIRSDLGEVDATIEGRIQVLLDALDGQD